MTSGQDGLMELTEPARGPQDAIVDIVFVHGLNGDRKTTWTLGGCCWPQELLPTDIPEARILTFGYQANIISFWSPMSNASIDDHADKLREGLLNLRSQSQTRPIIFVAHSLGGLVCEEAILKASKLDAYKRTVADCTHGIAFLGTPHQGSDKTKWAKIGQNVLALLGKQDSTLLQDLEKQSSRLAKLGQDFPEWLRNRAENTANKVSIMCFFEELDTITGGKSIGQIVTKDSARLAGGYETLLIHADHVGMCKCKDRDDSTYKAIVGVLQKWIQDLEKADKKEPAGPPQYQSNTSITGGTNYGQQLSQFIVDKNSPISFTNWNGIPKSDDQQGPSSK